MVDLAVVVVTWNVRELAINALHSLYDDLEKSDFGAEVWVVDSASSDGTAEAVGKTFPWVRLVASGENLGFGRGNNTALREIGFGRCPDDRLPRAVYLLNPDTITQPGATRALYDAVMSNPRIGLAGARLQYGDGSFQHSSFHFPGLRQLWVEFFPTPGHLIEGSFNGRYPLSAYESPQPFPVDFVLGATMMLRREVIQQTGMFDEQFFMYCEEIDWAWRIRKAGWEVCCVPAARVVHLGGQSTAQARPRSIVNLWASRLHLYRKHYSWWKVRLARWMVMLGMRRRISQIEHDADVSPAERKALLGAYQAVYEMARAP